MADRVSPTAPISPYEASETAYQYGGLARWCLDPALLAKAQEDSSVTPAVRNGWTPASRCPQEPGGCSIVFVTQQTCIPLRSAFILPFRWRRGFTHDRRLPATVVELANQVCRHLANEPSLRDHTWGLDWSTEITDSRIPELNLDASSGWAALAAGLLLAAEGGKVDSGVWASAHWEHRIQRVKDLDRKLALARDFGVHTFFVPESQVREAQDIARQLGATIKVKSLVEGESNPRKALKPYLYDLKVPPTINDSKDERRAYYLSPDLVAAEAAQYYRENLLPDIIRHCRADDSLKSLPAPDTLITIASDNPELVILGIEVLRPRRCLVLCTEDKAAATASARQAAAQNSCGCKVHEAVFTDLEQLRIKMAGVIRGFIANREPDSIVFDLTPGPKDISFSWMLDIAPQGSKFYYLQHQIAQPVRRVIPFSERPVIWSSHDRPRQAGAVG